MENNWEDFESKSKSIIKELTKKNKNFEQLIAKLNSAREKVSNEKPELVDALHNLKK